MKMNISTPVICMVCFIFLSSCKEREKVRSCIGGDVTRIEKIEDSVYFYPCLQIGDNAFSYHWDFGDGYTAEGTVVRHLFSSTGTYIVTLTEKGQWNSDTTSVTVKIVNATNQDYAGTYNVQQFCYTDSSSNYVSSISAKGTDSIVFHNFHNNGIDLSAVVDHHTLIIPTQLFGVDTIKGFGYLNATHNNIAISVGVFGADTTCWIQYNRQ